MLSRYAAAAVNVDHAMLFYSLIARRLRYRPVIHNFFDMRGAKVDKKNFSVFK